MTSLLTGFREYPAATDRSGKAADYKNYTSFLKNLRKALDGTGLQFGLSITIVCIQTFPAMALSNYIALILLVYAAL